MKERIKNIQRILKENGARIVSLELIDYYTDEYDMDIRTDSGASVGIIFRSDENIGDALKEACEDMGNINDFRQIISALKDA